MKMILKFLLVIVMPLSMAAPAAAAAPWIDYSAESFARAQAAGQTILVDIYADWCPTCKAQRPTLDALRSDERLQGVSFVQLDFDKHKDFLRTHRVPRQSTILVFKGKKETGRSIAETDPERLRNFVLGAVK
jgi:thioredoxin 1